MRLTCRLLAGLLSVLMEVLSGGAALRESVTIDEVAHIGAGVSYLQKLDLRMNPEHPPLPKVLAALPLVCRGVRADYSHISWTGSEKFLPAFLGEWVFGDWLLERRNDPVGGLSTVSRCFKGETNRRSSVGLTSVQWLLFEYNGKRKHAARGSSTALPARNRRNIAACQAAAGLFS